MSRSPRSVVLALALACVPAASAQVITLGSEELLDASSAFAQNQRPRVIFTNDVANIFWLAGPAFASEGVFTVRAPAGSGYGSATMVSQGLDGVRYGLGDGLTVRTMGSYLVTSWEGTDFANRPVWFARSSDAGGSWEAAVRADPDTEVERAYSAGTVFPDGRVTQVWMEYEAGTGLPDLHWRTQDAKGVFGASSFPAATAPQRPCECCNPEQAVLDDGSVLVAFRNNQNNARKIYVARSTDGGATFPSSVKLDQTGGFSFVCPSDGPSMAVEGQNVLVVWAKSPGGVASTYSAASTDGGVTFGPEIRLDSSDGTTAISFPQVARRGDLAVAVWRGNDPVTGQREIWAVASLNGGASWFPSQMVTGDGIGADLGQASVAISPNQNVEIVWRDNRDGTPKIYRVGGTVDATSAPEPSLTPSVGAWPNPFRAGTTIQFALPVRSDVRLLIHDAGGRRVAEVHRTSVPAGGAEIAWDGRDTQGRPVGAGVYFARVETATRADVVRVVRLR